MTTAKRVAVIGAGASGLTAIKCCLDEGITPVCFERSDYIGGLWHYTDESRDGQACVMKSTVINTSKEMMCFSDFPIPKEYPIFMHNKYVLKYFHLYAEKFDLTKHINFQTEVLSIKKHNDFKNNGCWDIKTRDLKTNQIKEQTFDGVLVCTGHHAEKNIPTFPGLDKFKGEIIHSHDYKTLKGYEDKRIVIIGIGNSGGDAAVELSRVANQVFLSTRQGSWVINRVDSFGYPVDMMRTTQFNFWMMRKIVPASVTQWITETKLNMRFDHALYSLKPNFPPLSQHPTVNDDLPNRIISGNVIVKPNIKCFTETGVEFEDGTKEENIDVVFLATGYIFGFPFLDKSVLEVKENRVNLYKWMFPPDLEHNTLAVIGCIQPLGAIMPLSEQQCRLYTRVLKGEVKLPPSNEMWQDIKDKVTAMAKRYVKSTRHTIQVDYVVYLNELAALTGNCPDLVKLFFKDPRLAMACFFGPCTPYQYRLVGPGKWTGARESILTQWNRTFYPLKTRPMKNPPRESQITFFFFFLLIVGLFTLTIHLLFMR
ncbi:flavin-containing monooxygenase 5-like [Saccostrea cucullata]|uniref:flavin-containing monooxygenase 5-like n=1 Tax=Saccostrea cuccullata TaxID=36930 RepID=UPI002ED24E0F